jgi:hypothetical protein
MATKSLSAGHDPIGDSIASNSSSGSQTTRLTPESDSGESDLELDEDELGHSIKLRQRDPEKPRSSPEDDNAEEDPRRGRRGSASTMQSYQLYTPDEERAVVRKFDRRLVLIVALLYMLSFLDRSSMLDRPQGCRLPFTWAPGC